MTQCNSCDRGEHEKCNGTVVFLEQDGEIKYLCTCECNVELVELPCTHCGGRGTVPTRSFTKNRSRTAVHTT